MNQLRTQFERDIHLFVSAILPNHWTVERCIEGMIQCGVVNVVCRSEDGWHFVDVDFGSHELDGKTEMQKIRFIFDRLASTGKLVGTSFYELVPA